ncbi:uncharacterized protein LOC143244908 [Tachypleus tridentatus]|uniref:uncharacterized protein LOC143244908 n=1 Tax=Tachypleus tridentatus TaxID=6853 RepID=UPI003FCF8A46
MRKILLQYLLLAAVAVFVLAEDLKIEDSQSRQVQKLPIKYGGPVVYSGLPPPVVHFPSFPQNPKTTSYGKGEEGSSPSRPIEYIPFPFQDLPVLIYQSQRDPPIHVVDQSGVNEQNYETGSAGSASANNVGRFTGVDTTSYSIGKEEGRSYKQTFGGSGSNKGFSQNDVKGVGGIGFDNGVVKYNGAENSYRGGFVEDSRDFDTNVGAYEDEGGYRRGLGQNTGGYGNNIASFGGLGVRGNEFRGFREGGYRQIDQGNYKQSATTYGEGDGYKQVFQDDFSQAATGQVSQNDYRKAPSSYERGRGYDDLDNNAAASDTLKIFASQPIYLEAPNEPQPVYVPPPPSGYSQFQGNRNYERFRFSESTSDPIRSERGSSTSSGSYTFHTAQGQRGSNLPGKGVTFADFTRVSASTPHVVYTGHPPIHVFPQPIIVHKPEKSTGSSQLDYSASSSFGVPGKYQGSVSSQLPAFSGYSDSKNYQTSASSHFQTETTKYKAPEQYSMLGNYHNYQLIPTELDGRGGYLASASNSGETILNLEDSSSPLNEAGSTFTGNIQNYHSASQNYPIFQGFGGTIDYVESTTPHFEGNSEDFEDSATGYGQASTLSGSDYGNGKQQVYSLSNAGENYGSSSGSYQSALNGLVGGLSLSHSLGLRDLLKLRFRNSLGLKRPSTFGYLSGYKGQGSGYDGTGLASNVQYTAVGGYGNQELEETDYDVINGVNSFGTQGQKESIYENDNLPVGSQYVQSFKGPREADKGKYNDDEDPYPKVNYRVPPTFATAAPRHHKPPIIIYQGVRPPVHVYNRPASETPTRGQNPPRPSYEPPQAIHPREPPIYRDQASVPSNYYQSLNDGADTSLQNYEIAATSDQSYSEQIAQDGKPKYPKKSLSRDPWRPVHLLDGYVEALSIADVSETKDQINTEDVQAEAPPSATQHQNTDISSEQTSNKEKATKPEVSLFTSQEESKVENQRREQ